MKTPLRPNWARTAVTCGVLAASAIPAFGADALTPPVIDGPLDPNEVLCMATRSTDEDDGIIFNVTPVNATAPGNGLMAPFTTPPTRSASHVNFGPGTVDPNLVIAPNLTPGSGTCFKNSKHARVDVILDWVGTITGEAFRPSTDEGEPVRVLDTRRTKPVEPNGRACYSDVPNTAVVVNVTPVNATAPGHGTVVPGSVTTKPKTSNVNYVPGSVNPNMAIVTTDSTGTFCFMNSASATTDVVMDLMGYLVSDYTPAAANGSAVRVLDTRTDPAGVIEAGERRCFTVPGNPGDGAMINLTPVLAQMPGHGTLVSSDVNLFPNNSSVNFDAGTVDPNVAMPEIGADGKVCYLNSYYADVHLIADSLGSIGDDVFEAAPLDGTARTRIDTRIPGPVE